MQRQPSVFWAVCGLSLLVLSITAARAATIPIFVFAGQSNAVGYATNSTQLSSALLSAQPNVLYAGPQESSVAWGPLQPPTQFAQVVSGHGFGPELTAGKTISQALGKTVGEVKFAVNGTNLYSQWNPSTTGGLYSQMVQRVNTALTDLPAQRPGTTGKVAGFFWMQGESDVGRTTAQYETDLRNFIASVRTAFGDPNLPFVFGLINDAGTGTNLIRQAQMDVAANIPNGSPAKVADTFLVDTDGYQRDGPNDLIHFTTQGTVDLGIGFGNGYLSLTPEPTGLGLLGLGFLALRRRR